MKKYFILFSIIILSISLLSETIITDGEQVNGIWALENSPFIIEGEAIVSESDTLFIEPGVIVKFAIGSNFNYNNNNFDASLLRVNGKLVAEGTVNDSILFTRNGDDGYWGAICITAESNQENIFEYCSFSYSNSITNLNNNYYGAISAIESSVQINKCLFSNNNYGISLKNSDTVLNSNNIQSSSETAIYSLQSNLEIINNVIENNRIAMYTWYKVTG